MTEVTKKPDWKPTQFVRSQLHRKLELRGVMTDVAVSPYDVPEGVRAYRIPDTNQYVIEFKYLLDDEDTKIVALDEGVSFMVGKSSNRLYAIQFRADSEFVERIGDIHVKLKWSVVDRSLNNAHKQIVPNEAKSSTCSFDLAKSAIRELRGDLVPA